MTPEQAFALIRLLGDLYLTIEARDVEIARLHAELAQTQTPQEG